MYHALLRTVRSRVRENPKGYHGLLNTADLKVNLGYSCGRVDGDEEPRKNGRRSYDSEGD